MVTTIHNSASGRLPDGYLTVPEAATRAGVHPATVRRWVHQGMMPRSIRMANRYMAVHPGDLSACISADTTDPIMRAVKEVVKAAPILGEERAGQILTLLRDTNEGVAA